MAETAAIYSCSCCFAAAAAADTAAVATAAARKAATATIYCSYTFLCAAAAAEINAAANRYISKIKLSRIACVQKQPPYTPRAALEVAVKNRDEASLDAGVAIIIQNAFAPKTRLRARLICYNIYFAQNNRA